MSDAQPSNRTPREALEQRWLGLVDYETALANMRERVEQRARGEVGDAIWTLEHEGVYTAGRRDAREDLVDDAIQVHEIERGGRITWHGPGQLVAYPICALSGAQRDLHAWLRLLEDTIIDTLASFDLVGTRDPRGTGVFVGERKIASIGIAVRRWVTFHGVALNVSNSLDAFAKIRPCGFDAEVMTSLQRELAAAGQDVDLSPQEASSTLMENFARHWQRAQTA